MARSRNKKYKQGDRINVYVSKDVTDEFMNWINKQSDLSNFFLYAAQQLYAKTGDIDVSEIMPRKINFDIKVDKPEIEVKINKDHKKENKTNDEINTEDSVSEKSKEDINKIEEWDMGDLDDDPFA
ncbi:hypothetical protein ACTOS9_21820 (plasmid) [Bacillus subtilis]|uniref:Uncharacterized protein n=1 Tax=Bacillus subtilis TaxID=1423 RepID=A0A8I1WKM4_BACIU|nr:hypothetical protein [Bacillus subtilis]MBO3796462.1 hypothetical protein [Bacillus subtilis]WEY82942.1 hypothetical protein P5633_00050 [Bacillus subtilis]WGD64176.1 hypothetical protein P5648_22115 [Bacillus subtilis]WGD72635.1 hypothetical protein P5645_22190 [Bacillus subtilis]